MPLEMQQHVNFLNLNVYSLATLVIRNSAYSFCFDAIDSHIFRPCLKVNFICFIDKACFVDI